MIQKTVLQGLAFAASFVALWFALSKLDFVKYFHIEQNRGETEQKIGDLIWESIEKTETVIKNDSVTEPLEKLFKHIAKENDIDKDDIHIHIIENSEINAFALPAGHLVVYTGLLEKCDSESELAGVLGHEIAHIEKDHVMKKLVKEFGLAMLVSMTTGGKGGNMTREMLHKLSSTAYDRSLESEADRESVEYLEKANLDPEKFGEFLFDMSRKDAMPSAVYWVSTHPESEERALEIIEDIKGKKFKVVKVLTDKEWKNLTAR
ncbi:MAG: M48 family metallopeptidase [Flavobacterium sp.]|uniref:M48 family metallopeptidase n=1 Tax=Flavobacterium sp. TaxID=239 RepID=UPI001219957B|nr:M48 family metallopeptidase [Flavobacterium sp.]RZJ68511.1 MAG: M48 family metallopeptidase [Flavobacterium sp.]